MPANFIGSTTPGQESSPWLLVLAAETGCPTKSRIGSAQEVNRALSGGKNVLVHCCQGVGRTGLLAACLLVRKGLSPGAAIDKISGARGVAVPETEEQREWIDHFAAAKSK
jgi:hypothetical protein